MWLEIYCDGAPDADALRGCLLRRFDVPAEGVYIGPMMDRPMTGPDPVVIMTPPDCDGGFGWSVMANGDHPTLRGLNELEFALALVGDMQVRMLVDDDTAHPDRWILVAADGSYGPVITDPDAAGDGDLRIVHAEEPISGEPDLPVVPRVIWD